MYFEKVLNNYVAFAVEAQRQVQDYKFKLKKAEQDITTLEGNVSVYTKPVTLNYYYH